jgi:hypothetical protein
MEGNGGVGFDASLLENLPLNQFNWTEWNVSLYLFESWLEAANNTGVF